MTDTIIPDYSIPRTHHLDRRADKLAEEAADGDPDELLTDQQLALLLGVSVQWVQIGRGRGYTPPCVRLSPRVVRTRRDDLHAWLLTRTYLHRDQYRDPTQKQQGRPPGGKMIAGKYVLPTDGTP